MWNVHGAKGSLCLQWWSNIIHLVSNRSVEKCGMQEYDPAYPLPEAATAALHNEYKCYAAPGTGLRLAVLAKDTGVPHILEII